MRYVKPHYYDKFQCAANRCADTCCAGWQIVIDDDSLEKYGEVKGAFGSRLRNSIDWQEGVFYQYNRRCSFLNEKNFCDIYQELGKDALCETCRMYPRHVEEYEGLRELSLTLSCPVAAEMILGCKEKVQFEESFTDEEDDFEEFDFLMFSQLEDARDVIFKILQNREWDLRFRIFAVSSLAEEFQKCMDEERAYDIDNLLVKYSENIEEVFAEYSNKQNFPCTSALKEISQIPEQYENTYERRLKEWGLLNRLERLRPEWAEVLLKCKALLYSNGKDHYANICREFQSACGFDSSQKEQWSVMGEQLMMFFVYTYFCGAVYDDMVRTKMGIAVFSLTWIQELLMARWLENGKKLEFSDVTEIAWRYAREVEHSDQNLDMLEEWLEKSFK